MAAPEEECYFGDDFEAILYAIKDNLLYENEEFTSELNAEVEEVGVHPQSTMFSCDICEKVCKTHRGLTRHRNSKHCTNNNAEGDAYKSYFEEKLHPIYYKQYIEESALKLSVDECYSEKNREEFSTYKICR